MCGRNADTAKAESRHISEQLGGGGKRQTHCEVIGLREAENAGKTKESSRYRKRVQAGGGESEPFKSYVPISSVLSYA